MRGVGEQCSGEQLYTTHRCSRVLTGAPGVDRWSSSFNVGYFGHVLQVTIKWILSC